MDIKEDNSQEPQKQTLNIPVVRQHKYWYRDDVEVCVLCGKETHRKKRVYNESEKGTFYKEGACWMHF